MIESARKNAFDSLLGLAVGDALGSQFFAPGNRPALTPRTEPPAPWQWTDDTEMACSVWSVLRESGHVDQDALAKSFAVRHDSGRGYGPSTNRLLRLLREGGDWRELTRDLFGGQGSWGNGAAMRVAPLGAWFSGDPVEAAAQAALSAEVTHTHPDAVSGAVAVAVAAALAAVVAPPAPAELLDAVLRLTPPGLVRQGIGSARAMVDASSAEEAAHALGNGSRTAAWDTVPFALWSAARHLEDFEQAFWATASAGGDVDTTCAIVGGIVAAHVGTAGIPARWRAATESLPPWAGAG
jgi:ADP-ribosylglycohydrolase